MLQPKTISKTFITGLKSLGFYEDDALFFTKDKKRKTDESQICFHLETANEFGADAIYLRQQLKGDYKIQAFIYDYTHLQFNRNNEIDLANIQKKIWSSGEAPIACIFFKTEIKILDCTKHTIDEYTPVHLVKDLKIAGDAYKLYNEQFAIKIKSGLFWDAEENKNNFKFKNSSYDKLIDNVRIIINYFKKLDNDISKELLNKIIIQSILIKFLEERIDSDGKKLLSDKFFRKYEKANSFIEVLRKGKFTELLNDLNDPIRGFNGNVFHWDIEEQMLLKKIDLSLLADLLDTRRLNLQSIQAEIEFPDWRYFEFKYIPVELISRLYEEFLAEGKKQKGLYYTPSHLAKLLVDECIPLKKYKDIDLGSYTVLDPACGSGIFLVSVFKRLAQVWRLQNNMRHPDLIILKQILRNIYGVDKEVQAVNLASFSLCLALCTELEPLDIITKLKFDDLKEKNIINSDFFECEKIKDKKFDLVIGNPPFVRGGTKDFINNTSIIKDVIVNIPNNQIALKFLADSYGFLKPNGLQCLIIKSSGLLYNTTSRDYLITLFTNTNVVQILDFTGLARNKALWDNKQGLENTPLEVDTGAIFIRNGKVDFTKNILHLTFRRSKATKERIFFEIDDYDLHYINRNIAINNSLIWKNNLLGGGRINNTIEKLSILKTLGNYLESNKNFIICAEGIGGPKSLPNEAFNKKGINAKYLNQEYITSFENKKDKDVFFPPTFIIKKNIDLPNSFSETKIKFNNEVVGFHSDDANRIKIISEFITSNLSILKFYNICTSGKMLVYKNTACKKEDILAFPFEPKINLLSLLSEFDKNIIEDINNFMQAFLRNGENSKAVEPIVKNEIELNIKNYGTEFSKVLNLIYENKKKKFRLSDIVELDNSFIATIFKYDTSTKEPVLHKDNSKLDLKGLTDIEISKQLSINRIIKLYPQKDTIVFIKPNQYRYWLSLIAYRDADKCFADLSKLGY